MSVAVSISKPVTQGLGRPTALVLMTASGFAALGYQIVWTQQSALWLGHEAAAVLAVVAAFFGGLALGALWLGQHIERSARPAYWYAACEAVIGLWSVALVFLMTPVTVWLLDLLGAQPSVAKHWAVSFLGVFLLLLPATAAMGATLPAMERALAQFQRGGSSLAALYACNTLGAVLGVLATAFWLVPAQGLLFTAGLCALLNFFCAVAAPRLFSSVPVARGSIERTVATPILLTLAATGFLGIGYEVLVVRVLSQVAENTVYTFAILLTTYLLGTALGAALYSRNLSLLQRIEDLRDRLLQLLALTCLLGILSLSFAAETKNWAVQLLGPGMSNALAAEAVLAMLAFFLPTIVMGALFSHLSLQAQAAGVGFGRAIGVNTLGAALAPLLCGVVLVISVGPRFALLLVVVGYTVLVARQAWFKPAGLVLASLTLLLAWWAPPLVIIDVPAGGKLLRHEEGALGAVSIVEDAQGVATLHINNRQQEGSTATQFADARQALLPILLHPDPQRALFFGLGTGVTSRAAAQDPRLQVDVVELVPEVIAASSYFTRTVWGDGDRPNLNAMAADARRYARASTQLYDVVIADNFHPARSGSAALYTVEHFQAVRARLAEGGLFCQWLPLHQLDLTTLASIVRSFMAVYPQGWAMLATNSLETPVLGLVATRDGDAFAAPERAVHWTERSQHLRTADFGLPDALAVFGSFVAGPEALARFSASAPRNTDNHPVVAYLAPRITYEPDSLPRERLLDFLHALNIKPEERLTIAESDVADVDWRKRLAAYRSARNRYLEAGYGVKPTTDIEHMLAQVREPLLSVLRISPDFQPAYDPLLTMASVLARRDVNAATALLTELQQLQPARSEAEQMLNALNKQSQSRVRE